MIVYLKPKLKLRNFTLLLTAILLIGFSAAAQRTGVITGTVQDINTGKLLENVIIRVNDSLMTSRSDSLGKFRISLPVGTYRISASLLGFTTVNKYNITAGSGNFQSVDFQLQSSALSLGEVRVSSGRGKSAVATDLVTPLSVQQLTTEEIRSSPGGNFDVSKVVQTLPGVGISSGAGERNDVIVRGGAPNENVYYLDGIEIPVLNHFQTQGSSGGAQGILNVSFIESLKLSSSAFDARYDNALASTFVIKQREGNPERISGNARLSLTESVLTLEGPLAPTTTFLASARKSYLSLLFNLIDLPIRPDFYDFQYKVVHKFNPKTSLTAIGLGAIDRFSFAAPRNATPENQYILRSTPYINQWNYTAGFNLNRKIKNGYFNISLSRNAFDNALDKFEDATQNETTRTLGLQSRETENKFRSEFNTFTNGWRLAAGIMAQQVSYHTAFYNLVPGFENNPAQAVNFSSKIAFWKYGSFFHASKNLFSEKLLLSAGIRNDMNSFTSNGSSWLKTLSPRFSLAYHLSPKWDLSASVGRYYKIPTYTALGYRATDGNLMNKNLDYIRSEHLAIGTQFLPANDIRFALEGYYKKYSNYPVSLATGISLANQGSEYTAIGSEALLSIGRGETYGFEFSVQQKLISKFFYLASYSFVRSTFSGLDGNLLPSSWDNRHLLSLTLGYRIPSGWDFGLKYRYAGGTPYTPFDLDASRANYLSLGTGISDYSRFNSQRLKPFSQLDFRVDRRINFRKTALVFYIDIQNLLKNKNEGYPRYTFQRNNDSTTFSTTDGQPISKDGANAIPVILDNLSGNIIPSLGLTFEF